MNGKKRFGVALMLVAGLLTGNSVELPAAQAADGREVMRKRTDPARNRTWVLGLDEVRVYGPAGLVKRQALPGWMVADFLCPPDLAIDRSGSAYISSNAIAKIWRIDGESFAVTEYRVRLVERDRWDTGFSALAFAADGALLGITTAGGTAWRIDPGKGTASLLAEGDHLVNACEFNARILNGLKRKPKP